jgi:catalase
VQAFSSDVTDEDWEQPRMLWKIFKEKGEDEEFLDNLSGHLNKALPEVQKESISKCLGQMAIVYILNANAQRQQICGAKWTRRSAGDLMNH